MMSIYITVSIGDCDISDIQGVQEEESENRSHEWTVHRCAASFVLL